MHGEREVGDVGAHLEREARLGDQLSGAGADDAGTQHPAALGIDEQLGAAACGAAA